MTDRKQRTDTAAGAVEAMQAALAGPIEPPAHVRIRECDRPYWLAITGARARNKWDDHDLAVAGNLARSMAELDSVQAMLEDEGYTTINDRGTRVANPLGTVAETLTRRIVALSRMLHIHAEAKQGKAKLQGKSLEAENEMAERVAGMDDDGLIPGLGRH